MNKPIGMVLYPDGSKANVYKCGDSCPCGRSVHLEPTTRKTPFHFED